MINIDFVKVETSRTMLRMLLQETSTIADPLAQSKGSATDAEKEIIELLLRICNTDLPALFNSSEQLLAAISDEFQRTEQSIQSIFEK